MLKLLPHRWFLSFFLSSVVAAQSIGTIPSSSLDVLDPYTAFQLAPLKDSPDGPLAEFSDAFVAWARARKLGLSASSAIDAWAAADLLLRASQPPQPVRQTPVLNFQGVTASALNLLLADPNTRAVHVSSAQLTMDQPILIRRGGISLDLGDATLSATAPQAYLLRMDGVSGVWVRGGQFVQGKSAIVVNGGDHVRIERARISGMAAAGIVVTGAAMVTVAQNQISGLQGAGILLHGGTASSVVRDNRISGNLGTSNMAAGIVMSDREVDLSSDANAIYAPDGYGVVSEPMLLRLNPPHDNIIGWNQVSGNLSSGLYVDGAIRNIVVGNTIENNAKEGLCFDNGSAANVLTSNVVRRNGQRWGQSDAVLRNDGVLAAGRLPDGTAATKLPAVSLDNALYNVLLSNDVAFNYGGGIKIVRSGFFNLIGLNTILKNNQGASSSFHFFGIELGAAPGDSTTNSDIDLLPSLGNAVFSNVIRGDHYSGIFFDAGSEQNDVSDNVIMDATNWALESVEHSDNSTINNLTSLPSRNIGPGLDPALLSIPQVSP